MLRIYIIFSVVYLSSSAFSLAQQFSVGVVAGTYLSSATNPIEMTAGTGYNISSRELSHLVGLRGEYNLHPYLTIGMGANWQILNYKGTCYCHLCGKISTPPTDITIEMLDIPIYLRAYFLDQSKLIAPYVAVGISNQFSRIEEVDLGYKFNLSSAIGSLVNINNYWSALLEFELSVSPEKRDSRYWDESYYDEANFPYFKHQTISLKAGVYRKF